MRVKIDKDEWYPVYSIGSYGFSIEVPEETVKRWKKIEEAFLKMQKEMKKYYEQPIS
jgi:hypothetical protein